jgi:hypothetical protein
MLKLNIHSSESFFLNMEAGKVGGSHLNSSEAAGVDI